MWNWDANAKILKGTRPFMIIVSVSQFQVYLVGTFSVIVKTNGFAALHKICVHASDRMSQCLQVLALYVSVVCSDGGQCPDTRVSSVWWDDTCTLLPAVRWPAAALSPPITQLLYCCMYGSGKSRIFPLSKLCNAVQLVRRWKSVGVQMLGLAQV